MAAMEAALICIKEYLMVKKECLTHLSMMIIPHFVKILPKDSLTKEGEFEIFWPCRGAPPRGNWEFNIKYSKVLTNADNYFLFKGRYTDLTSKEFIKAWEGKFESNTINIRIIREQ